MHRILVTGGAGYIGSVLVRKLLDRGESVRSVDLCWFGDGLAGIRHERLDPIRGDIRDTEVARRAVAGCHGVVHLAAVANDPCGDLDPELTRSINLDGTRNLLRIARQEGVARFVFASTASIYGIQEGDHPVIEETPAKPLTLYASTKLEGERRVLEASSNGFCTTAIRSSTVGGVSTRMRFDLTVNKLTVDAAHHGRIRLHGGSQRRPTIHIGDLTDLYLRLLEAPASAVSGEAFNLGNETLTIRAFAERVRTHLPECRIETEPVVDTRDYRVDSTRVKRVLGFAPARSVDDSIREVLAAYRAGTFPDPEDTRHYNIRAMRSGLA